MLVCLLALAATPWVSIAPASLPAPASAAATLQDGAAKKALTADDVAERLKAAEAKVSQAELLLSELGQVEQVQTAVWEASQLLDPILKNEALAPRAKELTRRIREIKGGPAEGSVGGRDAEVAAMDESLKPGSAAVTGSQTDIRLQVLSAIQSGNVEFLRQLGPRSVPGLLAFLNGREGEYYKDIEKDPLAILVSIAPKEADAYVLKRMQNGPLSVLFKLRFARVMASASPFGGAASWKSQTPGAGDSELPNLLSLCDQLVTDPEYQSSTASALYSVVAHGIFLPGMRAAIQEGLASPTGVSRGMSRWFANNHPRESIRDLLLNGFHAPHAKTRTLVRKALMEIPNNAGIYEQVLAGPAEDRAFGIQWLEERSVVGLPQAPGERNNRRTQKWLPPLGDGAAAYVDALLSDQDPAVLGNVAMELYKLGRDYEELAIPAIPEYGLPATQIGVSSFALPFRTETLMALAAKEDYTVRYRLAGSAGMLPWQQQQPVLAALAKDTHPDVRVAARRGLSDLAWYQQPEDCTKILSSSFTLESDARILHRFLGLDNTTTRLALASRSPEGLEALIDWAVATQDQTLLERILTYNKQPRGPLNAVAPATQARALLAYADSFAAQAGFDRGTSLQFALRAAPRDRQGPAARAILDSLSGTPAPSIFAQTVALHAIPREGDDRIPKAIATWLSTPEGVSLAGSRSMGGSKIGVELVQRFPDPIRAQAGEALLKSTGAHETINRAFRTLGMLPVTSEIAAAVVAEPAYLEGDGYLAGRVATWMASNPDSIDRPWLGALVDHPSCGARALGAIGRLRDTALLPVIARVIEGPATHPFYSEAADALKGFLSDDSARLLLIAARKTPSEDQRTWCLAQVEKIAALQDAEERWASRGIKRATREATVSKLMALLGSQDKAVRIEAIRGLATWEAVEAMPELIELLAAPDADVAQAAREALDRLNGR